MRLKNLIGQVFGRLTVKERVDQHKGKVRWKCECSCGGITEAYSNNLKRGFVTSCGCFRREFVRGNQLPEGESGFNGLYGRYQKRAFGENIPFLLSKDEFRILTQGTCFYCGSAPSQSISSRRSGKGRYSYSGIDRKDSDEGYTKENCVPCCKTCNYMKLDMSIAEFISACEKVIAHQNRDREKP